MGGPGKASHFFVISFQVMTRGKIESSRIIHLRNVFDVPSKTGEIFSQIFWVGKAVFLSPKLGRKSDFLKNARILGQKI